MAYIDAYKEVFGVEPFCRVFRAHGFKIAPSTYDAFKSRPASARQWSDVRLLRVIRQVNHAN